MIKPLKTYKLPDNLEDEINSLQEYVDRFKKANFQMLNLRCNVFLLGVMNSARKIRTWSVFDARALLLRQSN